MSDMQGIIDITAFANVANAQATATIPVVAGKNIYITGFEVTGNGATAAAPAQAQLSWINTTIGPQTLVYFISVPAGAVLAITPLIVEFTRPRLVVPGNVGMLQVAAFGAGNTQVNANLHGFYA
jgi:hypothetical protein